MATIVIKNLDGTTSRLSYCLTHMCRVIEGMYGDRPTMESYHIEGIHAGF